MGLPKPKLKYLTFKCPSAQKKKKKQENKLETNNQTKGIKRIIGINKNLK